MKLASVYIGGVPRAVEVVDDNRVALTDYSDVADLLRKSPLRNRTTRGEVVENSDVQFRPVLPRPGKIICVGLNYKTHIIEMKRELPRYPTLFAKFSNALIGPQDDIQLPAESDCLDWEVELAFVIGERVRRVNEHRGLDAIAGYTIMNDITARDWQNRTPQWLQGKTFESTTPLGPWMVTADEISDPNSLDISCTINNTYVQQSNTSDLLHQPGDLVSYISQICTLEPGDVIATGTPGGVGSGRTPPWYLSPGDVVTSSIAGIGTMTNTCVIEDQENPSWA